LAIFRNRLPSGQDAFLVLVACSFPIFVWSAVQFLQELPAFIIREGTWNIIGLVAYTQMFALRESLVVSFFFFLLGALLPARFFRDKIVPLTAGMVFTAAFWFAFMLYNIDIIGEKRWLQLAVWASSLAVAQAAVYIGVLRRQRLAAAVRAAVERLGVLTAIYLATGIIGFVIVVIRNL
jgi:hypothetical protein